MGREVEVRLFPDSYTRHLFQVHAGFHDLHAAGRIRLRLTTRLAEPAREPAPHTAWAELEPPGGPVIRLCFDMADHAELQSFDGLARCHLYFKRSYLRSRIDELPHRLRSRVVPYGLNFACHGAEEPAVASAAASLAARLAGSARQPVPFVRTLRRLLEAQLIETPLAGTRFSPVRRSTAFEVAPDAPARCRVLYQTRLWDLPGEAVDSMNVQRIEIVRALRDAFGPDFIGGLEPNEVARKRAPELITRERSNHKAFLGLIRENLIGVASRGLGNSNGWKLPEYLAAARCVVSEPPHFELSAPLDPGVHYLPFMTPQECVAACRHLLEHEEDEQAMRQANHRYYMEHVRPISVIGRCVDLALKAAGAAIRSAPGDAHVG